MEKNKQIELFTTQMFLIRALVTDTLQEVKNLRKEILSGRAAEQPGTSIFTKYNLQFPLNTMENLNKFNEILNDERQFKDAVSIIPSLLISVFCI